MASKAAEAGAKARERRERKERASDPKRKLVVALVWLGVGVAVTASIVLFATKAPLEGRCPDHWHATFAVFVDDAPVQFEHPAFRDNTGGYHMHANDGVLHYHPSGACIALEDMMRRVGIEATDASLTLLPEHGPAAATYTEGGGKVVRFFHQPYQSAWREVQWEDIKDDQLGNGDQWLIHYGTGDEATIARQQSEVPPLPLAYTPP